MEVDINVTDMEDLYIHPREEYNLEAARYYPVKKVNRQVNVLPLSHLIRYDVDSILSNIREVMKSDFYEPNSTAQPNELREKMLQLKPPLLRQLFFDFLKRNPVDPIEVIKVFEINEPSPLNMNKPSVMGLETVTLKQSLRYVDNIYQPIGGLEQLALSIFFKYDHIPIIITM